MNKIRDGLYLAEDTSEGDSKGMITLCRRDKGIWFLVSAYMSCNHSTFIGDDQKFLENAKPLTYFPGWPVDLK